MNNLLTEDEILEYSRYIYNISLRMLFQKEDAEDATQEILIKILKNIEKFRKESKIETWIYRIAVNHLLDMKRAKKSITFEEFSNYYSLSCDNLSKNFSFIQLDEKS